MRLLVDENLDRLCVNAIRACGHDVRWINDDHQGIADGDVAAIALADDRIVVTQDFDFGELAVRRQIIFPGVIIVHCPAMAVSERATRLLGVLAEPDFAFTGHLTIVEPKRVRRRPIPTSLAAK